METILLLAHTEADGSLGKPALEALSAALGLGGALTVGLVGATTQAAADQIAGCGAVRFLAVTGEAFGQPRYATDAAAAEALVPGGGLPDRDRRRELAVGAGPARSGVPAGRPRGHACDRPGGGQWCAGVDALVLPPADGGGAGADAASVGGAARRGVRGSVDGDGGRGGGRRGRCGGSRDADDGHRLPGAGGRSADDPAGCQDAAGGGRGVDEEAGAMARCMQARRSS